MSYVVTLNREQRRERRCQMAAAVRDGKTCTDVAVEYGVTVVTVCKACEENQVTVRRGRPRGRGEMKLVVRGEWEALDWSRRDTDLAMEVGVCRERIRQVRKILGKPRSKNYRKNGVGVDTAAWADASKGRLDGLELRDIAALCPTTKCHAVLARACRDAGISVAPRTTVGDLLTRENLKDFVNIAGNVVDPCWEWPLKLRGAGYPQMGRTDYGHRRIYELFNGAIPDGLWVLHHCDNPKCVNPKHLYAGTAFDNARDRSVRGRCYKKLTAEQVTEIRKMRTAGGYPIKVIAKQFGVTVSAVYSIVREKTWRHLLFNDSEVTAMEVA